MKKSNYYSIHKNKKPKPKLKLQNTNWKSIYDVISKATELVISLIELRKSTLGLSKPIPKYKKIENSELAIVRNNFGRNPKNIGEYKKITDDLLKVKDYGSRSGNNPERIFSGMDFGFGDDSFTQSIMDINGVIHVLKHNEQLFKKDKININVPECDHIYAYGIIQEPEDKSKMRTKEFWQQMLNEGKITLNSIPNKNPE